MSVNFHTNSALQNLVHVSLWLLHNKKVIKIINLYLESVQLLREQEVDQVITHWILILMALQALANSQEAIQLHMLDKDFQLFAKLRI